jgi:ectoine hydroxylase-related dioxygenase (phytanoyl-CoA dioxygenase family)
MTEAERLALDTQGYVVLERLLDEESLTRLRARTEELYELEGEQAGSEFLTEPGSRRLANLVDKGKVYEEMIVHPRVLELVGHVLGPRFKLSSLNARSANAHSEEAQPLHCDAGALPDERGYWVCNTIWCLDAFTETNGPTRVVPGSQDWGRFPQASLADARAPHPEEVCLTAPAGSVIVMNTHAWHGGTANRSDNPRSALHAFYCRFDKPQQQYQKRMLRPETQAQLSPDTRKILALDDPLNDELSAAGSGMSGFMKKGPA